MEFILNNSCHALNLNVKLFDARRQGSAFLHPITAAAASARSASKYNSFGKERRAPRPSATFGLEAKIEEGARGRRLAEGPREDNE